MIYFLLHWASDVPDLSLHSVLTLAFLYYSFFFLSKFFCDVGYAEELR